MTVGQISEHDEFNALKQVGVEIGPPGTARRQIETNTNSVNHTDIYQPLTVIRHYLTGQLKTRRR